MSGIKEVKDQLRALGVPPSVLVKSEVREIPNVLFDNETIQKIVYGWYASGFAILLATTTRLIFLDKVGFKLVVADIPYSSVMEVEYELSVFWGGKIVIYARPNTIKLKGIKKDRLRDFARFVEQKIERK